MKIDSRPYILELKEMAKKIGEVELANKVLDMPQFALWSACSHPDGHHYGNGGLAKHTYEVARLCLMNADEGKAFGSGEIDYNTLFIAALYHDVGKIWDYKQVGDGHWTGSDHKRTVHHVSRSAIFWSQSVGVNYPSFHDDVLHCILSHHGRREHGSPVAPLSREAWILHLCDGLSARMSDCDKIDQLHRA